MQVVWSSVSVWVSVPLYVIVILHGLDCGIRISAVIVLDISKYASSMEFCVILGFCATLGIQYLIDGEWQVLNGAENTHYYCLLAKHFACYFSFIQNVVSVFVNMISVRRTLQVYTSFLLHQVVC